MNIFRDAMRGFNKVAMVPWFHRSGGPRKSMLGGQVCLLRTICRRSGQLREAPLSYAQAPDGIWVSAGFGRGTGWVHNLRAQPDAEVQLGRTIVPVHAMEITDPDQGEHIVRAVMIGAGAAGFLYGWDPRHASREQIRRVARNVIVFHLAFKEAAQAAA